MEFRRVLRHLAAPALALAVVTTLPLARQTETSPPPTEFKPVTVAYGTSGTVKGQILSYNDFHGAIDPPSGSGAVVNASGTSTPAGGVEYLATYLKKLRAEAKADGRQTITAGA